MAFINKLLNILSNNNKNFWIVWIQRTLSSAPFFETLCGLGFVFVRLLLNESWDKEYYLKFEAPFYDTGTMMSFLICLEHLYVCYYLIIIIIMVYWFLYICIMDFSGWTVKNKGFMSVLGDIITKYFIYFTAIYLNIYKYLLIKILKIKEMELIYFLIYTHVNFSADESIPLVIWGLFPFHFKKAYLNNKNIVNIFINFYKYYDILGRSYLICNFGVLKFLLFLNIVLDSINLIKTDLKLIEELVLRKNFTKFLYYTAPKSYFFFNYSNLILNLKKKNLQDLSYNYSLLNIRSINKEIFIANNFKHSGLFEGVWAAFPTFIIICILIPSLILLYSFEDILNPRLSVKVIGNQWYWTYEFDNWIQYKTLNTEYSTKDLGAFVNNFENVKNINLTNIDNNINELNVNVLNYINDSKNTSLLNTNLDVYSGIETKNIYTNYAFDSVMLNQDNLLFGTKRLLEVDNRLVLPTNVTTRFLVSSADVLHSFAVPELGFKVDATPGRLNQLLIFISRPGVYYGQCSELCGANHAFMPIVIQSVLPETYLSYIEDIHLKTDLKLNS